MFRVKRRSTCNIYTQTHYTLHSVLLKLVFQEQIFLSLQSALQDQIRTWQAFDIFAFWLVFWPTDVQKNVDCPFLILVQFGQFSQFHQFHHSDQSTASRPIIPVIEPRSKYPRWARSQRHHWTLRCSDSYTVDFTVFQCILAYSSVVQCVVTV